MATQTPEQSALFQQILDLQNQESAYGPKIFALYQAGDIAGGDALKAQKDAITAQVNDLNVQYAQLPNTSVDTVSTADATKYAEGPTNANTASPVPNPDATVATDNPSGETTKEAADAGSTDAQAQLDAAPDNQTTPAVSAVSQANSELIAAQQNSADAQERVINAQTALDKANEELAIAYESGDEAQITAAEEAQQAAQEEFDSASTDAANAAQAVDDAQTALDAATAAGGSANGVTNGSSADAATAKQNANPSNIDSAKNAIGGLLGGIGSSIKNLFGGGKLNSQPGKAGAAGASFGSNVDMRVKLRVPSAYLTGPAAGPGGGLNILNASAGAGTGALAQLGGIMWPYTPTVSLSNQASYQQNKVVHSNYAFYNYQNSSVGPISVSGKFTAQNEYEAAIILSIQHLLRALTKMKFGDDADAGAPPPVCRLDAYGDFQMKNVPVAVASFKVEMPDSVDYIQVGKGITGYGNTMVPTVCTISVDLNVMYSRQEMLQFSVDEWLKGSKGKLAGKGYL
jgi:hypothetical protein